MNTDVTSSKAGAVTRYGGSGETMTNRKAVVSELVRAQSGLFLERPTERIPLGDTERLQETCNRFINICAENGALPSFQGLAALCGVSRQGLYDYLQRNPDSPSGILLEKCRTLFMFMRQTAADRGAASEAQSIFLAKNSFQGYADRVEIEPVQPANPLQDLSIEEARQRILDAIPMEDED